MSLFLCNGRTIFDVLVVWRTIVCYRRQLGIKPKTSFVIV